MSYRKCLLLFLSLFASAHAVATSHLARSPIHHRAHAHRAASPSPIQIPSLPVRKRASGKRCKQRSTSSLAPATSSTAPVANVVPTPSIASTSSKVVTTTQEQAQPTTTTTKEKPTTTEEDKPSTTVVPTTTKPEVPTQAAEATSSSDLPSFMVGTQTGQGTHYNPGMGACGMVNTNSDFIAAASHLLFDNFPGYTGANPNNNPICNRKVNATYQGKSVTVSITDRCEACAVTDLDFSPHAFDQLADETVGRISGMTWEWL
ncbi:RlpA-like double-psi beta-barrel-protein domain-containing protein-containing protein [Cyathus striatus]|nr:RlpA-like double-psi beta-barrel-protein domain-containing protein-containing protein [Cyathus striatus]KAF8991008.1 RlpA-like double-psi beta-barrel-protein domain-containing protein-containing protein [Cyathus striatus]